METKWTVIVLVESNEGQKKSKEPNLAKRFPGGDSVLGASLAGGSVLSASLAGAVSS